VKLHFHSYRYAREILEHPTNKSAWKEICGIVKTAPLFVFPGKSDKNKRLEIVQQLMNTYFDRRFVTDHRWDHHPLATKIKDSGLSADFRKRFPKITIQAEVQFGNMSRWYADIFKFQTAYSQGLIQLGLCVVPMQSMGLRIDSNVAHFERITKELPSADLSITLPILVIGLEEDATTPRVDVSKTQFIPSGRKSKSQVICKNENSWRVINGYIAGKPMKSIGPSSPTGRMLEPDENED